MRAFWLIGIVLLLRVSEAGAAPASDYFYRYSADCEAAYNAYLALRIPEGNEAVRRAIVTDPGNLLPVFLADYDDCLTLMLNGDAREYALRKGHYEERLQWIDKGPDDSPWTRLTRGVLHLHWALVQVRFGERVKAALAFRKSYQNLKDNARAFPDFPYTAVFLGFEEAIAGTIPEDYQWIASVFGVKGSTKRGVQAIGNFLDKNPGAQTPFREEARLFHTYLRFYLLQQQEVAWRYVNSPAFGSTDNLLQALVSANIALNYRRADAALVFLRKAQNFPESRRYPVLDYELGNALLHKLDPSAGAVFERYLATTRSTWYRKDARQKVAWSWLLAGRADLARQHLQKVAGTGTTFVDADKQAQRAATEGHLPHPQLLGIRLLCDGGYYAPALQKLAQLPQQSLTTAAQRLEYLYRAGRTYEGLGNTERAFTFYQTAYQQGQNSPEHFAARAALQTGFLQEKAGNRELARQWFGKALALRRHDFQASIDQQAKAGLDRLRN